MRPAPRTATGPPPPHSHEDPGGHEQEEGVLHQVGVGGGQPGEVGVGVPELLHPQPARLHHGAEAPERPAGPGRGDAGGGRVNHCFMEGVLTTGPVISGG